MSKAAPGVIAVGASLGGLDAVGQLLEGTDARIQWPMVIVQHRRADGGHGLLRLLRMKSVRPLCEPDDGEPLEPGRTYLAPPGYHLLVDRTALSLSTEAPVTFSRPSIDVLFESASDAFGPWAIGVMLTSSSADGAAGMQTIARRGGVNIVQDPETAESPTGPRAAIQAARVRHVLRLDKIPAMVAELCRRGPPWEDPRVGRDGARGRHGGGPTIA
jgi:two-component system, chemotaxis family, protein-glutamate methylesterase/glutaminase